MKSFIVFILLIAIILFIYFKFVKKLKIPKINSLVLVTGGVKTGKTTLSVAIVMKEYKSRLRYYKIANFFRKIFKKPLLEKPLIYSNIPLNCDYSPLTEDLLLRKTRFVYGSVIYCCEASLVADSTLIKNMDINDRLLLFNKLIGHETKGGVLIYDTQCIADAHYSIKRAMSQYFYIHHLRKIPFFLIAYVRELVYSDDSNTVNNFDNDVEESLKKVLISKKTWKLFDCYCYSALTDDLPVSDVVINGKDTDLKAYEIVSFNPKRIYKKEVKEDEKA